jgi:hypothetical protein
MRDYVLSTDGGPGSQRLLSSVHNACTSCRDAWGDVDEEEHDLIAGEAPSILGWWRISKVSRGLLLGLCDIYAYLRYNARLSR